MAAVSSRPLETTALIALSMIGPKERDLTGGDARSAVSAAAASRVGPEELPRKLLAPASGGLSEELTREAANLPRGFFADFLDDLLQTAVVSFRHDVSSFAAWRPFARRKEVVTVTTSSGRCGHFWPFLRRRALVPIFGFSSEISALGVLAGTA